MIFFTDGSAHPNPGSGGYGIVGVENDKIKFVRSRQYSNKVTNNEMELKAILYVMINFGEKDTDWSQPPVVYSDSSYCVNIFNNWMFNWKNNGWKKSDKKEPENLALIKAYYDLYQKGYRIDLRKIKGHSNNKYNNIADGLATGKISEKELINE